MKHNYFIKLLLAIVFCSVNSLSYGASPIYLAATGGSDGNDGTTVGTAVATLTQAMTLVDTGGTIIVSGMVSATSETTLVKNVTIQGTSNTTDGFTGNTTARFINNAGFNLTLSNLKFTSYGVTAGNGGVLLLSGGTVSITNVNFDNNKALLGGTIYASAGTITLEGCTIQNNDNSGITSSKGGAIYVNMTAALTMNVNNTLIKSNKTASDAGGIYYNDAAAVTGSLKFTNCAFISNSNTATTGAVAAAFAVNNATVSAVINVSFINTTIHDNTSGGTSGGAGIIVNLRNPSSVSFIGCTIANNKITSGATSVAGAGIRVLTAVGANLGVVKFYNTILENNYCTGGSINATTYTTDFVWQNDVWTAGTHLIIENSMICRPFATTKYTLANFPNSKLNYLVSSTDVRNSYLAKFGTFNSTYNFLPLQSGSFALGYGTSSHLTGLTPSISTDQIGIARLASTCDAGAIEQSLRVIITSTSSTSTPDSPIPVTITFNKSVTGFDVSDITVTNGTKGTLSGSGATYTLDITPTNPGTVTVDIAANVATESGGSGNVAATQFTRTYAPVGAPPTVIISSTTTPTTQTNPIPVTITFSEAVTGFDISDIMVGNGTKSNFVSVSGLIYTVDITPTVQGIVTIDIDADVAMNGSSTGNTAATRLSRTYYKDIYLSATGNDANDGFTPATAVAKLSTALGKAITGEKIYVSGMIDFSTETLPTGVTLNKNITIQGTSNATDGFDGKNQTRFFIIGNNNITLKNLKLKDGYSGNNHGGAISINTSSGSLNCENVIFDANKTGMNTEFTAANRTGGAIYISNIYEASFKNCVFSNNEASKTGAIYINNWAANKAIHFEGCAFVSNIVKESFGGSAVFILTTNDNNTISFINCTFAKNEVRSTANGGTIYVYKGSANTVTNIINCTVSENTTAGTEATGAGVYFKNSTSGDIYAGKLYIQNSIIEGNKAANNVYSDLSTAEAPTTTTLQINNCLIGKQGSSSVIPTGCFGETNQYNYLTSASTTNAYKGGLASYNSTSNVYPLYSGSLAIDYGASTYLTSLSPTVTTDQLGNVRTVAATNYAGAWESTPIATTTPLAPTSLVATAGDGQASIAFTTANTGGSNITNYKYSTDGTNFVACSPIKTTSPIVITGLSNDISYAIKLKAVNANGDSPESIANSVTPRATANDIVVSSASNVSALSLTPVSDVVVSGDVLTINQATNINSLTVSPGAKVTVSGTNALTATNGITLESDASGTATIIDSYATPTLSATVKQYVTAGRNWYMSAPVSTSGVGALSRGNSVVEWNEATKTWDTKSEGNLVAGKGYIQVANASQGTTGTVNFSGLTNSGEIPVTVSRTESGSSRGFNLVGNPYPSYIDWDDVIADSENASAGLSSSFWYRTKNTLGAFVFTTYNGTSNEVVGGTTANTTINNLIPPMQAFWIKVNENVGATTHNTTLKFKNTMREHGVGDNNKFKAPKSDDRLRLRLKLENGSVSDETLIYFDAKASDDFDNYDSPKMMNNSTIVPDLYSKTGAERLVINGLSELRNNMELPIGFSLNAAASLKLQVSEITNLPSETRIYLLDKVENTQTELVANTAYSFSTTNATSNNESRFSILFRSPNLTTGIDKTEKTNVQVNVSAANQIVILVDKEADYAIYNAVGQLIENGKITSNSQTSNYKFTKGIYVVKVNNQSTRVVVK